MIEICKYHGSLIDIDQLYGCWSLIDFDPARQHPWCGLDTGIRYTAKHIQAAKRHLNFKAKWSTAVLLQNRFWWEERVKDSELELRWKTIGIYWKDHLSWNMLSHWNMFENHKKGATKEPTNLASFGDHTHMAVWCPRTRSTQFSILFCRFSFSIYFWITTYVTKNTQITLTHCLHHWYGCSLEQGIEQKSPIFTTKNEWISFFRSWFSRPL